MLDNNDIEKLKEILLTKEQFLEVGVTKDDIKDFALKDDITKFKDEILTGQDQILKELKTLTQEKIMENAQDKRKTEVLKTHNEALKRNKILTDEESLKISQSSVF